MTMFPNSYHNGLTSQLLSFQLDFTKALLALLNVTACSFLSLVLKCILKNTIYFSLETICPLFFQQKYLGFN